MAKLRTTPPPAPPIPRIVTPPRYGRYDLLVIDEVQWTCPDHTTEIYHLARADNPDVTQTLTRDQINLVRFSRGFRHVRDYFCPELQAARVHAGTNYICDLPDDEQKEILWKQEWCLAALRRKELPAGHPDKISFGDAPLENAMEAIANEVAVKTKLVADAGRHRRAGRNTVHRDRPSITYLRNWCNKLVKANMNPLALRDRTRKCGNRTSRLDPVEYAFLVRFAAKAATPEKPKPAQLHRELSAAIAKENERRAAIKPDADPLEVPSEKRLRIEIKKISKFEMMAGRQTAEIAKNYFRALTTGLADVIRPLQRVEFDEWDTHLHVLAIMSGVWETWTDEQKEKATTIRLVLCLAIDAATDCVVGLSIANKASSENASRCLDMVVSDKQPYADAAGATTPWDMGGTPETAAADAGSSFANEDFRAKNVDLGVKFMTTVAGLPWLRGKVERVFRTTDDKFAAMFAGRTFGNVVEKGDYDSEGNACLTVDEFALALVRYKVDHYHNSPHEGLGGRTPRTAWLEATEEFGVDPPPDGHLRRVVFGMPFKAMLGAHGLRVLGIDYNSADLNELFRQEGHIEVDGKVDLMNLGAITAKIGESEDDGEEWVVVDGPPELFRVTATDWIATWDELQARNEAVNAITRKVLDDTITYLMEVGRIARARRNIAEGPMDDDTFAHHQKRMNIGAKFASEQIEDQAKPPVGLFDGALAVGDGPRDVAGAPNTPEAIRGADPAQDAAEPVARNPRTLPKKDRGARWDDLKD